MAVTQCCRNHILARLCLTDTSPPASLPDGEKVPSISSTVLNSTGIDRAELERSSNDGPSEPTARDREREGGGGLRHCVNSGLAVHPGGRVYNLLRVTSRRLLSFLAFLLNRSHVLYFALNFDVDGKI